MKTLSKLHDAYITGIKITDNNNVVLFLGNAETILTFYNVEHMKIDNFQLGNIVFEINIYDSIENIRTIENLLCLLYNIERKRMVEDWFKARINKIEKNCLILIEIVESYGTNGIILCENYSIKLW